MGFSSRARSLPRPLLALLALGCGAPSATPVAPGVGDARGSKGAEPLLVAQTDGRGVPPPRCEEPAKSEPNSPTDAEREKAIDLFLVDRSNEAVELLSKVAKQNPRDRAAESFRLASIAKREESRAQAQSDTASLRKIRLVPIPLGHVAMSKPDTGGPGGAVELEKVSEKANQITDFAAWERSNGVESATLRDDNVPAGVARAFDGMQLRRFFVHADHTVALYAGGDPRTGKPTAGAIATAPGKQPLAFIADDAINGARRPFELTFAQVVGRALVVELAYNGYAKESGNRNGYVAAYDVGTGALHWSSDALVSNAREMLVSGGSVVTGYGFTAEPDFLFVLDLATGTVRQKIPVKSGPEALRRKGDRLFVRTYETDYVFKSKTGFASAAPAVLPEGPRESATAIDAQSRCWVRRATAAIQARDARGIEEAALALRPTSRDRVLAELLEIEIGKAKQTGTLDLQGAPLLALAAPPWDPTPTRSANAPAPRLVKLSSRRADPTRDMNPRFDPQRPFWLAPVEKGRLPVGARADIPRSYGLEDLRAIIPDQKRGPDRLILVYGSRYVALVNHDSVERVLDFETFTHPPKVVPSQAEFAIEDVTYAQERDGTLFVCNGGGSYAKEVFGKKGFVSAVEASSGRLLWRSPPLVCGSMFLLAGDHLVTGYGFTAEPHNAFVLRAIDGSVAHRLTIESSPYSFALVSGSIHVEMYGHVAELGLK